MRGRKGSRKRLLHFQKNSSVYVFPGRQRKRNADVAHAFFPRLRTDRGLSLSLRQKGVRGVFFSGAADT